MYHINELCTAFEGRGIKHIKNAPLRNYSTFRIGGEAALTVFPTSAEELISAVRLAKEYDEGYIIIGNGSNILFADDGYDGLVICTVNMKKITLGGENDTGARTAAPTMTAECGASLTQMSLAAMRAGLTGIEFLYGIPGACGGGVYMNAGAYGAQMSAVVSSVECYDTTEEKILTLPAAAINYAYRHSVFMENKALIILSATLILSCGDKEVIESEMKRCMRNRREKQPLEYPSAGSVFKRHPGFFMGEIIEKSGLKGFKIGGAQVSEKHAGFIINTGGATAKDVIAIVEHIKKIIQTNYGFNPECEIIHIKNHPKNKL